MLYQPLHITNILLTNSNSMKPAEIFDASKLSINLYSRFQLFIRAFESLTVHSSCQESYGQRALVPNNIFFSQHFETLQIAG